MTAQMGARETRGCAAVQRFLLRLMHRISAAHWNRAVSTQPPQLEPPEPAASRVRDNDLVRAPGDRLARQRAGRVAVGRDENVKFDASRISDRNLRLRQVLAR